MENSEGTTPVVKKILLAAAALIFLFSAALVILYKSGLYINLIERLAGHYIGKSVTIGGIDLQPEGHKIIITDVGVSGPDKDDMHVAFPRIEIDSSLSGLFAGNIRELRLPKASLFLTVKKMEWKGGGGGKIELPFQKAVISDASVVLQVDAGSVYHIDSLSVDLARDAGRGLVHMSGSALISELDSRLMMEAEIDTVMPALNKGHIGISARDLHKAKKYAPALKRGNIRGSVDLSVDAERKKTDTEDTVQWSSTASLRDFVFHSKKLALNLKDRYLEAESRGIYDLKRNLMKIDVFRTGLSGSTVLNLYGTVENIFSEKPGIHAAAEIHGVSIRSVQDIISGPYIDRIREIDTDGAVSATFAVDGDLNAPEIRGEAHLSGKKLLWKTVQLQSFAVRLPVALSHAEPRIRSETFHISAERAVVSSDNREYLAVKNISLKGVLEGNTRDRFFVTKNISLGMDPLRTITGSARINMNEPVSIDTDIVYDRIDVGALSQRFFPALLREKALRVQGSGRLQASLHATIPENASSRVSGTAHLTLMNAGFSSSDESMIGEGIGLKASSVFESIQPFSEVNFGLEAETTGFELLLGRFYGNFKDRVLGISAAGRYARADGSVLISRSRLDLSRIGGIRMNGTVSDRAKSPLLDVDIQVTGLSNREAFDFFIRDTFQERFPVLSRLKVDGQSSARLHIRGDLKRFTAIGDIHITDMDITDSGSGSAVRGMDMSLPVDLAYPEAPLKLGGETYGALRIRDISWSAFRLKNIEVHPSVRQNSVIFKEAVDLPVMGGGIVLKNISYGNIFSPERRLRLSVDVRDIDLGQVSAAFALPKFNGRLSGAIPFVRFAQNRLFTEGEITLEVFDGKMKIGDLFIDNVFSPVTSVKSSIEFEGIDLGQLTSTLDFGRISGVIRGRVDDLVIVNGQAEGFHAFVESYKKKGVSQKINVEALKKISILGTGGSPSILDRGIYRFFREYRYEKLGFRASLKNDNLLLLGIENEGDRGYLVKSGLLPPKVDVINYTHNISFQEMVRRLKRIEQAER